MSPPTVKSKIKVKQPSSESDSDDESEHELFYFANDRVRLMKEVLKLLKPKKIKAIAPDFMKRLDIEEINSMLLEELLGISNKRLKNILNGVNGDESSSESEDEKQPIDVISLDDISDVEDFNFEGNEPEKKNKKSKKNKSVDVKTEKEDEKEKLMSVLEILELQARARAIRSQLALESERKNTETTEKKTTESDDSDIEVVMPNSENDIVVIDSENEELIDKNRTANIEEKKDETAQESVEQAKIMNEKQACVEQNNTQGEYKDDDKKECQLNKVTNTGKSEYEKKIEMTGKVSEDNEKANAESSFGDDTIVINLDTVEIEEMEK